MIELVRAFFVERKPRKMEMSVKQKDMLARLNAQEIEAGKFKAALDDKVTMTLSNEVPGLFYVAPDELVITRFESLESGRGHLKQAFKVVCKIATEQAVDVHVYFDRLEIQKNEALDFDRFTKFMVEDLGFHQAFPREQFVFCPKRERNQSWAVRNLI